eukprot:gene30811-38082_t
MSAWAIEAFGEQLLTKDGLKSTSEVLAGKSLPTMQSDKKHIENLGQKHGIRGIPALIVLDTASGAVKDGDGRTTVSAAKGVTSKALKVWA